MNTQWLATSFAGGFWGMLTALVVVFVLLRAYLIRAFRENQWLKEAHEKNECPVCKRPMRHDHDEQPGAGQHQ